MRIISFAYTTPALLAGVKTVTRREWSADYAKSFAKSREIIAAYDRSPRFGGRKVAEIRLGGLPSLESTAEMPDEDYFLGGFHFLYTHPDCMPRTLWGKPASRDDFSLAGFNRWRARDELMWVVRFELVRITPGMRTVY